MASLKEMKSKIFPVGVKAKIIGIKIDRVLQKAWVTIELTYQGEKWEKRFELSTTGPAMWEEFKRNVETVVLRDFDIDRNLAEIKKRKSRPFNLF